MEDSMFRQKGEGAIPQGFDSTAEDANASSQSGAFAASLGTPVWRQFVANKDFQENNASAIKAEQSYQNDVERQNVRNERDARSASRSSGRAWTGANGMIRRKVGNQIEQRDANDFTEHPELGQVARRALWDKERRGAAQEAQSYSDKLSDPSFHARSLKKTDRDAILAEGEGLQETDPRHIELKQKLKDDDTYVAEKADYSQRAWDARNRNHELSNTDPEEWWANRQQPVAPSREEVVQGIQAKRQEADTADESATQDLNDSQGQLTQGVSGKDVDAVLAKRAEAAAGKAKIADSKQQAKTELDGVKEEAVKATTPPPQEGVGDFIRGAQVSVKQIPQLGYGVAGLVGATLEKTLGVGKGLKDWGFQGYKEAEEKAQPLQRENDDVTKAWGKAKTGDVGALVDWAQYGLGYALGQMGESLAVSAIGGVAGGAVGTAAEPGLGTAAGGVGGAVAGLVAKGAVKKAAFGLIEKAIASQALKMAAKEAEELAVKTGVKMTEEMVAKRAATEGMRKAAGKAIGSNVAVMSNALGMELGSVYPEAEKQAASEGRELSGTDLARVWGMGIAAGGIEGLTDKLGIDLLKGKFTDVLPKGKLAAAAVGGLADAAVEGGTELVQTGMERFGSGQSLTDDEAQKDYINSAAMGAIGGAGVGGIGGMISKKDAPGIKPEVDTHLASLDPEHAPATPDEIHRATAFVPQSEGAAGLAKGVLIERDLAKVEAEDAALVQSTGDNLIAAQATGDKGVVAAAEAEVEKAKLQAGRADVARAVMKISSGQDMGSLTTAELRAVGFKRDNDKIKPLTATELKEAGVKESLVYAGPDGSPILIDDALKAVEGTSPLARERVTMGEAEAHEKARGRVDAAAAEEAAQANLPEWDVPLRDGTSVRVAGGSMEEAEKAAAQQADLGNSVVVGGAKAVPKSTATAAATKSRMTGGRSFAGSAVAGRLNGTNNTASAETPSSTRDLSKTAQLTPEEYEESFRNEAHPSKVEGLTSAQIRANQATSLFAATRYQQAGISYPQPINAEAVESFGFKVPEGYVKEGDLYVYRKNAEAAPASKPAATPEPPVMKLARKRLEDVKKKFPRIAEALVEDGNKAQVSGGKISFNPQKVIQEALDAGLSDGQAMVRFNAVLDEEIKHLAQHDSAMALWEAAGKPGEFNSWSDEHYGQIWNDEFVATGKGEIVRGLYTGTTEASRKEWDAMDNNGKLNSVNLPRFAGLASWEAMPDANKAKEAIRAMMQRREGKSATEASRLWTNISANLINELRALLKALKQIVKESTLSTTLKEEINQLENALKQLTGNPSTDPKKPAARQKGDGAGKSAQGQRDRGTASPGGAVATPSDIAGASLELGQRVSVVSNGVTYEGTVGQYEDLPIVKPENGGFRLVLDGGGNRAFFLGRDSVTLLSDTTSPQQKQNAQKNGSKEDSNDKTDTGSSEEIRGQQGRQGNGQEGRNGANEEEEVSSSEDDASGGPSSEAESVEDPSSPTASESGVTAESIEADYQSAIRLADSWAKTDSVRAGQMRKAAGMQKAAAMRKLTGNLTGRERQAKDSYEASNYTGKPVSVDERNGKVTGVNFGKVSVKFEDGTKGSFAPDQINPPVAAATGQSATETAPKVESVEETDLDKAANLYSSLHQARVRKDYQKSGMNPDTLERSLSSWSPEAVRERVGEFLSEIDSKDVASLDGYNNGMFEVFWKLFQWRTGMKVPSSQAAKSEMIRDYIGAEAYDLHQNKIAESAEKRKEVSKAKDEEQRIAKLKQDAEELRVNDKGTIVSGLKLADQFLADGWRVENTSTGAVPKYQFVKGERALKNKGLKAMIDYAREVQKGMAAPMDDASGEKSLGANSGDPIVKESLTAQKPKSESLLSDEDKQKMLDALDGLFASSLPSNFDKAIPSDRFMKLMGAAESWVTKGVDSPQKLAAELAGLADGRLKPFSQKIWFAMKAVGVDGETEPNWGDVYGELDAKNTANSTEDQSSGSPKEKLKVLAHVSDSVKNLLLANNKVTMDQVRELDPDKVLSKKEMDEATEAGITAAAHQIVKDGTNPGAIYVKLLKLYDNQPSLNAKTSTSKINQAYSTPAPLGFVASLLADIKNGKIIEERTSGHGMLLMETRKDQIVQANEIDKSRRERTLLAMPESASWKMTGEDGVTWTPAQTPDRLIANPPFGTLMAEDGSNIVFTTAAGQTTAIDHAIMLKGLESMADDGRAVFIIGGPAKTAQSEEARRSHYAKGSKAAFFKYLHDNYGVVDHFTVDGDLYAKQGAGWNVDVITIQGKGKSRTSLPSAKAPRMIATWADLFQTTQLTDEQRIEKNQLTEEEVRGSVRDMADKLAGIGGLGGQGKPSGRNGSGGSKNGTGGKGSNSVSSESSEEKPSGNSGSSGLDGGNDAGAGSGRTGGLEQPKTNTTGESSKSGGTSQSDGDSTGTVRNEVKESGKFQAEYTPFSGEQGLDTLLPKNMVEPVSAAFERIKKDLGNDLTGFVRDQLGYPKDYDITQHLAGEQIDAVAAAIWNFQRGGALIIGDQTGIGKGRIAAALMKYSVNQGLIPVFMTKDSSLHDTMLTEDLVDIAAPEIIPAVMDTELQFDSAKKQKLDYGQEYFDNLETGVAPKNLTPDEIKKVIKEDFELVAPGEKSLSHEKNGLEQKTLPEWHIFAPGLFTVGSGKTAMDAYRGYLEHIGAEEPKTTISKLPGKSNAVFVTYSQIQSDDAKGLTPKDRATARNAGEPPAHNWRMRALKAIAPNAVFILDESHLASGQSTTGWRVADVIGRSSNVYYSSATSVKRPENMGIYFKTNIGTLTGGDMKALTDLMNAGGVPAMQVASAMLAKDGQYLRRERSFEGVKFTTQIEHDSYERDRDLSDNLTSSLRQIVTVQDAMRQAADAVNAVIAATGKRLNVPAANQAKLETVNFSSKLHNIVSQYLLAIKTASAADAAIREIKAGKKVVVTVQSTMESAIDGLENGGFEMSYKGLVLRYLDQMRFLTSGKKSFGKGKVETFEITENGPPELERFSSSQLESQIIQVETHPVTGNKIIAINDKIATELMRRAMWDVFERSRDAIESTELGDLPISPIDAMRQAVERAGIRTGEITGRSRGIDENGEIYTRSTADTKKPARRRIQAAFNNEDLDFLVINQSGSTGISLHASEKAKNQATRVMIVAQPNLDINEFMQTLGRIHRSGQVVKPEFILLQTALPAEKRPAAIMGQKMSMLNANTTSNSKTDVSEGNTAVDIFNQYGDEIAYQVFERDRDLQNQLRPLGSSLTKFFDKSTGNALSFQDLQAKIQDKPNGYISRTLTGYLAILPVEEQELFWEKTIADYQAYISYLDQIGQNALEAKAMDLQAKTIAREVFTEKSEGDSAFSDPSYIETVETKSGKTPLTGEEAAALSRKGKEESQKTLKEYLESAEVIANEIADKKSRKAIKAWDADKRAEFMAVQRAQRNTIASAIALVGRFGTIKRSDGSSGLGVIEEIKIDQANLLVPSKQIAIIRVNDSRETLRVPSTQLSEAFTPDPYESVSEWNQTTDVGGESSIVTGNLMAALKALSGAGKVITYTTDTGEDKMGILLPKTFVKGLEAKKGLMQIETAEKLLARLDAGFPVTNSDGSIKWTKGGSIASLSIPASRSKGGSIWRNPMLNRMAIGGEFTQVGNDMRATFYLSDVPAVFKFLTDAGEKFSSKKDDPNPNGPGGAPLRSSELPKKKLRADSPEWKAMSKEQRKDALRAADLPRVPNEFSAEARDHRAASGKNLTYARAGFGSEGTRGELDVVDAYYDATRRVQTNASNLAEAKRMLKENPADIDAKIEDAGTDKVFNLTPADHLAMQLRINQLAEAAGNNQELQAANGARMLAYRIMRGDVARSLQIGHDRTLTPADRALNALTEALYVPSGKIQRIIASKPLAERKAAIAAATKARVEQASKELNKYGLTLEQVTGKYEKLKLAHSKTMKDLLKTRKALDQNILKMVQAGASKKDIRQRYGKEAAGQADAILESARNDLREKLAALAATDMTDAEIVSQLGGALSAAALNSDGSVMTQEQINARIERLIELHFGLPKSIPENQVLKPKKTKPKAETTADAKTAARNTPQAIAQRWLDKLATSKSSSLSLSGEKKVKKANAMTELIREHLKTPINDFAQRAQALGLTAEQAKVLDGEILNERLATTNWSRPIFTEGLSSYEFETKDRAGIMERVEIIRGLAGAIGKIESLSGEKKDKAFAALADINKILGKYGTDAAEIFQSARPIEDYRFDINDINHVSAVSRMISAMDADRTDKAIEFVYSSMLSGLQTMMVNATAIIPAFWESSVGRGYELAINSILKDPMSAQLGEEKYLLRAMAPAFSRALSNFHASFDAQHPMFERDVLAKAVDHEKILGGSGYRVGGSISGRKGDWIRIPMRILMSTDDFNRTLMACTEVAAIAYRIAKAKGLKPGSPEFDQFLKSEVNTPGSASYLIAAEKASRAIFSNPLPGQMDPTTGKAVAVRDLGDLIGSGAAALNKFASKEHDNLFVKASLAALRVAFFPFQRTPFNILRKGIRHTLNPFSLFDIALGVVSNSRADNLDGTSSWKWNAKGRNPELIERMGQQLQGATLMLIIAAAGAGEGDDDDQKKNLLITGSAPFTPAGTAERSTAMRSGVGPYRFSFRRNDGSERFGFNYGRIEPIATTLAATIDTMKSVKRTTRGGGDASQAAGAALGGFVAQAQDKSFMKGLSDLIALGTNIIADPDVRDNRKLQQFLAGRLAMAIPNIIKQPIREADDNFRERSDSFLQELMYQAVPYGQKAPKIDPYGNESVKTGNAVGRTVDVFDTGTDTVNRYDSMLLRFRDLHPDQAWFPSAITHAEYKNPRTGKTEKMDDAQLQEFRVMSGKRAAALMKRESFNTNQPTKYDIDKMKKAHSQAREEIKKVLSFKYSAKAK